MPEVYDGFVTLLGGQNSGQHPLLLGDSAYARGVNISTRGGFASTRPGFSDIKTLGTGTFQGAGAWSLDSGDWSVAVISGAVVCYAPGSDTLIQLGVLLDPSVSRCWFTQVYKWLVIQDGVSRPVVLEYFNGIVSRRMSDVVSDPTAEAPKICIVPGQVGVYAHGRYHYVPSVVPLLAPAVDDNDAETLDLLPTNTDPVEDGRPCFVSSDILDIIEPAYVFRMAEHRVLAEGGAHFLPEELGTINGMGTLRGAATGTGYGSLVVFGRMGVCAFDVSIAPRSEWSNNNLGQVLFQGAGTASPYSPVIVNDDLWYVDTELNLRSMRYDKTKLAGGGQALSNTPMSYEMSRFIRETSEGYAPKISTAVSDNRLVWNLCDGKALGVLDFAQMYDLAQVAPPAYSGIWTGSTFEQVLVLRNQLYAIAVSEGSVHLLCLDKAASTDPNSTAIESQLDTRHCVFFSGEASAAANMKRLSYVELWLEDIRCNTTFEVLFRPDHYSQWTSMGSKTFVVPAGSAPQSRRKVRLSVPANVAGNLVTNEKLDVGQSFQFRLKWAGFARVMRFRAVAETLEESAAPCVGDNPNGMSYPVEDANEDFTYGFDL